MTRLSDETQLGAKGNSPSGGLPTDEPMFILRASDPLSGMLVRFWANANEKRLQQSNPRRLLEVRELAALMDQWRQRNSRAG